MGVHMGMLRRKGAADTESCWHLMASTFRAGPRCPIQASPGHRALFPVDLARLAHAHGAAGHELQGGGEGPVLGLLHPLRQRGLRVPHLHRHSLLEDDGPGIHLLLQRQQPEVGGGTGGKGPRDPPAASGICGVRGNWDLGWWERAEQVLGLTLAWEGFRGKEEGGRTPGSNNPAPESPVSQGQEGLGWAGQDEDVQSRGGMSPGLAQSRDRDRAELPLAPCWGRSLLGRGCFSREKSQIMA